MCLLTTWTWTYADILIHDVQKNPIVIIPISTARISSSYLRIGHHIDLKSLAATIQSLDTVIQTKTSDQKLLGPILKIKSEKVHSMFKKLSPSRQKRWESLGRAWKYVSGSPDADDLKIINSTMNTLIDQNNKQIKINSVVQRRLRNATETVNSLINYHSSFQNRTIEGFESVNLIFSLDELISQLEIIEEAITLARRNIPSSRIISPDEIVIAQDFLKNSGLGSNLIDNILDISSAYVLFNRNEIIYTLKVPRVKDVEYQLSYIEPVITNNHRIHLSMKYYLKGPSSFLTNTPCAMHRNEYICNYSQLYPLEECIQQLVDGKSAQCPLEKVYGRNIIKRIDDANIMVSAENITLKSNCTGQERQLHGSFLIQFSNCNIKLNSEEYANSNTDVTPRLYLPTTGLTVTSTKILNKMPLQYLQEFHLEQRDHIEHLNLTTDNIHWKLNLISWLSFGTTSTLVLVLIAALIIRTVLSSSNRAICVWSPRKLNTEATKKDIPTEPGTSGLGQDLNSDYAIKIPRFIPQ